MQNIIDPPAASAAAPAGSLDALFDAFSAPAELAINPLRELMSAERLLLNAATMGKAYRTQSHGKPADIDARRARERRRQKAKQAARRRQP